MSGNRNPVISLIIPTRERADTLKHTLQSALNQSSTDYEIVVCDNNSQDDTKQVVKGFADSRIIYLNTGKRLSMVDNWNYALTYARGDYVINHRQSFASIQIYYPICLANCLWLDEAFHMAKLYRYHYFGAANAYFDQALWSEGRSIYLDNIKCRLLDCQCTYHAFKITTNRKMALV